MRVDVTGENGVIGRYAGKELAAQGAHRTPGPLVGVVNSATERLAHTFEYGMAGAVNWWSVPEGESLVRRAS